MFVGLQWLLLKTVIQEFLYGNKDTRKTHHIHQIYVVVQFLPLVQFFLNQYKIFKPVQIFLNQYKIF